MDCASENFQSGCWVYLHIKLLRFHVVSIVKCEIPVFRLNVEIHVFVSSTTA